MATVKTFLIAASCGMVLLGAVAAQARIAINGANPNGVNPNGLTTPVPGNHTFDTPLGQGLPLNGLSQSALGKPAFDVRTP